MASDLTRTAFLSALGASMLCGAIPKEAPCYLDPVLPYHRPLELRLQVLDGPEFRLTNYRGYGVWLNFFASWCGPCSDEMPLVVRLSHEYASKGLRVVAVNLGEPDNTARGFRKQFRMDFPIAMDRNDQFLSAVSGQSDIPVSLFIHKDGSLACYTRGQLSEARMRDEIKNIIR